MSEPLPLEAIERLIVRARRQVSTGRQGALQNLMADLVTALETLKAREEEVRKTAYLDGVRSAVKVVRDKKESIRAQAGEPSEAESVGTLHDEVTSAILDIAHDGQATADAVADLARRLAETTSASADLDREVTKTYYALVNRRIPTSADVLPLGHPTRSLDVALAMATRLLPEGWWSLGANFEPAREKATALVGSTVSDDPDPQRGAAPATALLAAVFAAVARQIG